MMATAVEISLAGQLGVADELLERANAFLRIEVSAMIECHSNLRTVRPDRDQTVPIPGTLAPDVAVDIARHVQLIRDIEAHLQGEEWEGPVAWFDDVIHRRNGWEDGI